MLLSLSMMLCTSLVGTWAKAVWMICMPFSCRRSDGSNFTMWGQVHMAGRLIPWLLIERMSLCLEDIQRAHGRMRFPLFITQNTSSTQNPSVPLSILMGRPPNLRGSHPQAALPPCRLLTSETPVRMVSHWNLWV
ncbi:hypothetical protein V8E52_005117 [Russula decolorans]